MSEHDLDDAGDEFQRLFGYAMELSLALTAEAKQAERLRQALVHSVSLIQEWHNIGMSPKVASDTWDIYWRNAPELKPIRAAMEKANG